MTLAIYLTTNLHVLPLLLNSARVEVYDEMVTPREVPVVFSNVRYDYKVVKVATLYFHLLMIAVLIPF